MHPDEAAAFLRAIESGIVAVDDAGYVRCAGTRPKVPEGVYSLLSKSKDGATLNTEYLIQFGAAAELINSFGWPRDSVVIEAGEFDAVIEDGLVTKVAMEAKARVTGPDGLSRLLRSVINFATSDEVPEPRDNHSRKYVDLLRRCAEGPVILWLVAAGARWTFAANRDGNRLLLSPLSDDGLRCSAAPSPDLHAAVSVAQATEIDGEQRVYPFPWSSQDELQQFRDRMKDAIAEAGLSHVRPWRWAAETSGGDPLSVAEAETGLELRFSWYDS